MSKIYLNLSPWFFPQLYPRHIRILAHEEDQYTVFVSIALKQTKAEPRSSGSPFLI